MTFPEKYRYFGFSTLPSTAVAPDTYLTDFLTDLAIAFIEENRDRPFFLYLPHFAVHSPIVAKQKWIERYTQKSPGHSHNNAKYAAMIHSVDESVGRITARLEELELSERTVVIFYSDNGGAGGYEREGIEWFSHTDNAPLRGGKGMLYEGGIRVPLIIRWSGVTRPGSVCKVPVTSIDFLPTLLELAGQTAAWGQPLDGTSFLSLLKSSEASLPRDAIYWHYPSYLQADVEKGTWRITPASAIRSGRYKLLEFLEDGHLELYDLEKDIGERKNLASHLPEKTQELHAKLVDWRAATGAPMPTFK